MLVQCTYLAQFGSFIQVTLNAGKCLHIVFEVGAVGSATATVHLALPSLRTDIIGRCHYVVVVWNVVKAAGIAHIREVIVGLAEGLEPEGSRVEDG